MKHILILFFLLINLSASYGQADNIKKLEQQLPLIRDSLHYVDALNRLAMLFYEKNLDTTFYYTMQAREIANRLDYDKGKADALNNLGIVYDLKGDSQLALRYYNEAYNQYKIINDASNIVQTLMNIAMVYGEIGKQQKAIDNYKMIISMGRSLKNDSIMSLVIYNYLLQYPESVKKESIPGYINQARNIAVKHKDTRVLLALDQLSALDAIKNNQWEAGTELMRRTLKTTLDSNLYYLSLDMLMNLGDLYASSDSAKAVNYYVQGLAITRLKGFYVNSKLFVKKLYDFYTAKKNSAEAFRYSQQLVELYEKQEEKNNKSGVDYLDYAIKDQQLVLARTTSKYQSGFLLSAIVVCMMTIVIIIILWRNWKQTQKTAEALRLQFEHSEATMEAMDVVNKDYARLIKVVAHDLRNPIGAISAITGLIPKELVSDEVSEYVDLIRTSSKNCLELINELMTTDFNQ